MAHIVSGHGGIVKAVTEQGTKLKKFSVEDVETVLGVCAMLGGNASRTSESVKEEYGIDIHPITIRQWVDKKFPSRYAQIQASLGSEINEVVKGRIGELAMRSAELQGRLLDRLDERLRDETDVPIKELAPAIRNIAQSVDVNLKQKQLLENKPTHITEVRTIEETIEELERDEIIIDADVIEDDLPQ